MGDFFLLLMLREGGGGLGSYGFNYVVLFNSTGLDLTLTI